MDHALTEQLKVLPDAEFLAILQAVFQWRQSNATQTADNRTHYFLGIATCRRECADGEPAR